MNKTTFFFIVLLLFVNCSQKNDVLSKENKRIYEFSWCSYNEGHNAQDLNNELISYLGFVRNLKDKHGLFKETRYLNPTFTQDKYDFSWLDIFENELEKKAFYQFAENSEIYKNWNSSKEEVITCDPKLQTFYETELAEKYKFSDGDLIYVGFCKLKEGFETSYVIPNLKQNPLYFEKPYNEAILIPSFNKIDFDFLIYLETAFVLNNFNLLMSSEISNECEVYEKFSGNSLSFDTYIID